VVFLVTMKLSAETMERMYAVFHRYPSIAAVYLFGSQAEGRASTESDVDLAVIPAHGGDPRQHKLDLLEDLARCGCSNVDLVILDRERIVLNHEVVRSNRLVYAKPGFDPGEFFSNVTRKYLDFIPYLRVQREALRARLTDVEA
jgi:uncharacterized protein